MLIVLTGTQQTGKTRLLQRFIDASAQEGFTCKGVVSPGIWKRGEDGALVKLGIEAHLLPHGPVIPFAMRRDLSARDEEGCAQADAAGLVWRIKDDAIAQVNAHFDAIEQGGLASGDVLIVDELGALEFNRGCGFVSAMRLLEEPVFEPGANAASVSAVVIVRPSLVSEALARFTPAWGRPFVLDLDSDRADDARTFDDVMNVLCHLSVLCHA